MCWDKGRQCGGEEYKSASLGLRPQKEKKTCFMGGRTCQVGLVGQAFFFLATKMTLKHKKILLKIRHWKFFAEKFWENILTYPFKTFLPKFLDFGQETADFYKIWEVFFFKFCQNGKFGLVPPVKQVFFFLGLKVVRFWGEILARDPSTRLFDGQSTSWTDAIF